MPVDTRVQEALRMDKLDLPPTARILSIEAEDYVDWVKEDALRVWVTIAEDTTDAEAMNGEAILQITNAIHDSLLAKGIKLFPYTRFTKPSERHLEDEDGDDEES